METIYFRFIDFIGESKGFRFGSGTVVLFVLRKKAIVIVRAFIHQRGKKSSKRPVIHLQGGWPLLFTTVNDIRKKTRQPTREQKGNWQKTTQTFEYQTNILDAGKKQTANVNTHENGRFITCVRKS